jgi:serine/threonine protein kinase
VDGLIGREIAGFRVEREIGRGGMGVVYLATQVFPERRVALKLLSSDLAADPAFRERFVRESNAAASTEHPNIVPVYGAGESDGQLYLAMRFIEGMDLRTLLEHEGTLSPERAALICAQVADALEAAHERGLVHRDVKPGNVLLDARERAYLSDFGLIRATRIDTEITKTGQFMGTVDYVAPEQIRGDKLDGRADVYSLGCVLYECMTGSPPFRRDSEVATMYAHLEQDVPAPSSTRADLPRSLDEVVTKATARRPDYRFATAGEMAGALRGSTLPDGASDERGRRWIAIAALALVIIASVVGFWTLRDKGSPTSPSATRPGAEVPLDSLVQLDAETGKIRSTLTDLPTSYPSQVEVGEGGVWVQSGGNLSHVDPETSVARNVLSGGGANSLAVGSRVVWVGGAAPGIVRINPATDKTLRPVRIAPAGVVPGVQEIHVAVGASGAWALTSDGELRRLDPFTGAITQTVDTGQSASGLAVGLDAVWVIDDFQGTLTRVDPNHLEDIEVFESPGRLEGIAVGAGGVWILDSDAGVVMPFDPASGSFDSPIRVGSEPSDVATGLDAVWVTNQGDGTISRIDPVTRSVATIPVGGPVATIAVDEPTRSVWVVVTNPA